MIKKIIIISLIIAVLIIAMIAGLLSYVVSIVSGNSSSNDLGLPAFNAEYITASYTVTGRDIQINIKDTEGNTIYVLRGKIYDGVFEIRDTEEWSARAVFTSHKVGAGLGGSLVDVAGNPVENIEGTIAAPLSLRYRTKIKVSNVLPESYNGTYEILFTDETLKVIDGIYHFSFPTYRNEEIDTAGEVTFLSLPARIEGEIQDGHISLTGTIDDQEIYITEDEEGIYGYLGDGAAELGAQGGRMGSMMFPIKSGFQGGTSEFEIRVHPIYGYVHQHTGIDLACAQGSEVIAAQSGVVTIATWYGGYGNFVEITHPGGLKTRYGHNSELLVKKGDEVKIGQTIALSGSTGNSTGPHLHFEVMENGVLKNPRDYIAVP